MPGVNRRNWMKQTAVFSASMGLAPLSFNYLNRSFDTFSDSEEVVRLLFNENPYGPSTSVLNRIDEVKRRCNRYANFFEYDFLKLKAIIASQEGVSVENIVLGHGSIQPLIWVAILFGGPGKRIVVPDPAFDVVGSYARKIGSEVVPVPADKNLKTDLLAMEGVIDDRTDLVALVNPNNPTGTSLSSQALGVFCERVSQICPVCIDEAYVHFLGDNWREASMAKLVNRNPNIMLTRTFSKIYGMAGLRMGYLVGNKELVSKIEDQFMMGFPGNAPNLIGTAAAMVALEDGSFLASSRKTNEEMKKWVYDQLEKGGWEYVKSDANFFYFDTGDYERFKRQMSRHNILITGGWPAKKTWGRVTVGTEEDLKKFFKVLNG